ncbi:MAG: LPS export ABC transporter periplasmic protein LptC [Cellvibrionaceae bacterium]|nr:LPS export ABC transporter periplasmic protein LptC [Cellvibrionaceae bacterium]
MPLFWRSFLVLISLALLAVLLWYSPPKEFSTLLESKNSGPAFPQLYLKNADTHQYNRHGQLTYRLHAAALYYFENEHPSAIAPPQQTEKDRIDYQRPRLWLYDDRGEISWKISSLTADSDGEGKRIALRGDVLIEQLHPDSDKAKLQTEFLLIFPDSQYAETDKAVIIHELTGTTQTTGLKAFFQQQRIELLSNVSGHYVLP